MARPLERPGPIGRAVRIVAGAGLLVLFGATLADFGDLVGFAVPREPMWWVGAAVCFAVLADVINRGFGRDWGRWPQAGFGLLVLAALGVDLAWWGQPWGPPLGFLVFLLLAYVTGHVGLSFVLAGLGATPG